MQKIVNLIPAAMQHPEYACASIVIDHDTYKTLNYLETQWNISAKIKASNIRVGFVKINYHKKISFLREERKLLKAIAERIRKINERSAVRNKLFLTKNNFNLTQKLAKIGSWNLDIKTNNLTWSNEAYRIFEIDKNVRMTYEKFLSCIHPDDKKLVNASWKKALNKLPYDIEHRIIVNSKIKWVREKARVIFDQKNIPVSGIGTVQDITEKIRDEQIVNEQLFFFKESQRVGYIGSYKLNIAKDNWSSSSVLNRIFGIDKEYIKTTNSWLDLVHPEDREMMRLYFLDHVLANHLPFKKEYRIVRKRDQSTRWVSGLGKVEYDASGIPVSMIGTIQDITDRKQNEKSIIESRNRIESIISSIGDAVFAVDADGKIILFNKVAEQMTGIQKKDAIKKHYSTIVCFAREEDGEPCNDFIAEAIQRGKIAVLSNHAELIRSDGTKIPIADSAAPIADESGKLSGCVVVFHDVTNERKIDRAKTEFVSLASHQLRTPLSTINWYSEILLSEEIGSLTKKQKQYSEEVYRACQRMVALVNALLNVSRLELGTFAVDPKMINIAQILKTTLDDLKPSITQKQLIINEEYAKELDVINVDPKLMGIVLQNLLSNSIKYSKKKGKILIKIIIDENDLLISVTDYGIGIPKDQQNEIFTKLYRADNAKMVDPDGTGLGLYIVKEIIDYTGGKIWFISSEGKGATFYVRLPMSGMIKKTSNKKLI